MEKTYVKILQIGMTKNWGGLETYLLQQFENINKDLLIYDFVNNSCETDIIKEKEILESKSKVYKICSRRKNPLKHYLQWINLLRKHKNEYKGIVLNALSLSYVFPIFIAKIYGIPIRIIHSHNSGYEYRPGFLRKILITINKSILNFSATDYWACSQKAGEWMFGKNKNFKIIHNAIDTNSYKFDIIKRNNVRRELNLEHKFVVGHVGRFSYQKNHKFVINIFYEVQKMEDNAVLLLVGDTVDDESFFIECKKLVKELKLDEKVKFLGMRSDVPDLMQAMDCFLFPSQFEGLGIVAIEAQTAGLRCYLSDIIPEEVKITDLVNFISLNESPKTWADKILENRNYKRKDMTEKIKASGYDIKTEIKKVEQFYLNN